MKRLLLALALVPLAVLPAPAEMPIVRADSSYVVGLRSGPPGKDVERLLQQREILDAAGERELAARLGQLAERRILRQLLGLPAAREPARLSDAPQAQALQPELAELRLRLLRSAVVYQPEPLQRMPTESVVQPVRNAAAGVIEGLQLRLALPAPVVELPCTLHAGTVLQRAEVGAIICVLPERARPMGHRGALQQTLEEVSRRPESARIAVEFLRFANGYEIYGDGHAALPNYRPVAAGVLAQVPCEQRGACGLEAEAVRKREEAEAAARVLAAEQELTAKLELERGKQELEARRERLAEQTAQDGPAFLFVAGLVSVGAGFLITFLFGPAWATAFGVVVTLCGMAWPFLMVGGIPTRLDYTGQVGLFFLFIITVGVVELLAGFWSCFGAGQVLGLAARRVMRRPSGALQQ